MPTEGLMMRDAIGRDAVKRDVMRRDRLFGPNHQPGTTIPVLALAVIATVAGCGVDTATTAATGAAIRQQETDQGKKTMEQARQRAELAAQQVQQRAEQTGAAADK